MPIHFAETRQEVTERAQADIRAQLGSIDFLRASLFQALVIAFSGRVYETYEQFQAALRMLFPNTAEGIYLDLWGAFKGVYRFAAVQSSGKINATGTLGTVIDADEILTSASGEEYKTTETVAISEIELSPTSLTRSGSTATLTFDVPHNISTGISGTVAGADQAEYNGTFTLTATSDLELTYEVTGTPATPATGTITLTVELASISVLSIDFGSDSNLPSGSQLTFQTPISGVDDIVLAQFGGISGGEDQEGDESFRTRVLDAYSNPVANFNKAQIEQTMLKVAEVTRVWVYEATPVRGEFTAYFVLDERENIYPTLDDIDRVVAELNTIRPVNVSESDMIVLAPTQQLVDFTFTSLNPLTASMQEAVEENLRAFFFDNSNVGVSILARDYEAAIQQTIDPNNGQKVQTFTLSAPIGDIIVPAGSLAALGDINWNIP